MQNHVSLQGFAFFRAQRATWLALAIGVAASGCDDGPGAKSPGGDHPLTGKPAPEFDLPGQSGAKHVSIGSAQGKVAIVDFWATWCAPCRVSFPKYEALARKYSDDVVILGISEDDESDGIKPFAVETGATFLIAWDEDKRVAQNYHPDSMPTSFIVDRNGIVRFVHSGFRQGDEKEIEAQIKSLIE